MKFDTKNSHNNKDNNYTGKKKHFEVEVRRETRAILVGWLRHMEVSMIRALSEWFPPLPRYMFSNRIIYSLSIIIKDPYIVRADAYFL